MATASSTQHSDRDQPSRTVTRTARAARAGLLLGGALALAWTAIGAYQFAATYGSWYEHTIFVGGIGAILTFAALMTAHRVAPWGRPTRTVSIVLCLLVVAAVTVAGTLAGDRTHEQDTSSAASGWQDTHDAAHAPEYQPCCTA